MVERLEWNEPDARRRGGALVQTIAWRRVRDVAGVRSARHARPSVRATPALALVVPDVALARGVAAVLGGPHPLAPVGVNADLVALPVVPMECWIVNAER